MTPPPGSSLVEADSLAAVAQDGAVTGRLRRRSVVALHVAFLLSGFPALIYQTLWQRSLYTLFGVDILSVTLVVSAFLLGLGVGSLLGGALSRIARINPLALFGGMEFAIGLFGLASLSLIDKVGALLLGAGPVATFCASFALVLLPTVMMGATLPLLTAHLVRRRSAVGRSVGSLYFVNTLGSAAACIVSTWWLSQGWTRTDVVAAAALINFAVGAAALVAYALDRSPRGAAALPRPAVGISARARPAGRRLLTMPVALLLALAVGYISLSYEILWVRVYFLASHGVAHTFPLVLAAFLLGVAGGSFVSGDLSRFVDRRGSGVLLATIGALVLGGSATGYLVPPFAAAAAAHGLVWLAPLPTLAVPAALFGAVFPLVSHAAVSADDRAGSGVSALYGANIVGAVSGALITGLLLMDLLSIRGMTLFLAVCGAALFVVLIFAQTRTALGVASAAAAATLVAMMFAAAPSLFDRFFEKLQYRANYRSEPPFSHVVEGRSGVVTVTPSGLVFGTGVYDGIYNTELGDDRNGIHRAFLAYSLNPAPRQALMIGLSSGSWAEILANDPAVERLTIVEINPGYVGLLHDYPQVAPLLANPKVTLVIDDGRRWLAAHPATRFDLIVSNTTFHWRAGATNLLSAEFLGVIREHMNPGAIFTYNTTSSNDVQKTAATVFPYAIRDDNFMIVSNRPILIDAAAWRRTLEAYRVEGHPVLDLHDPADRARLEELVSWVGRYGPGTEPAFAHALETRDSILARTSVDRLVTDDNMGVEWTLGDARRRQP
jgi:spermidine synthase